jgi:hypothetical protein
MDFPPYNIEVQGSRSDQREAEKGSKRERDRGYERD